MSHKTCSLYSTQEHEWSYTTYLHQAAAPTIEECNFPLVTDWLRAETATNGYRSSSALGGAKGWPDDGKAQVGPGGLTTGALRRLDAEGKLSIPRRVLLGLPLTP